MSTSNPGLASLLSVLPPRYRPYAVPGAAAALVFVFAFVAASSVIESRRDSHSERVSKLFWELSDSLTVDDIEAADASYAELSEEGEGAQVVLAALRLAAGHYQREDFERAAELYAMVVETADEKSLRDVGRVRLAKSLIATEQYIPAKAALLEIESLSDHTSVVSESLVGDIELAEGNLDDAAFAYQKALEGAVKTNDQLLIRLLDSKLDALASIRLQRGLPLKRPESLAESGGEEPGAEQ